MKRFLTMMLAAVLLASFATPVLVSSAYAKSHKSK